MKRIIQFSFLLTLFLTSCSKVDLVGDASRLIGEWEWTHSIRTYDIYQEPPYNHQTIETDTEYGVRIYKNGKIKLYEDGKRISTEYISQIEFDPTTGESFHFKIGSENWTGSVTADSLKLSDNFPYKDGQGSVYMNHFVKVQ